jgi:hypothetical protein
MMSDWFQGSTPHKDGTRDCTIVFHNNDEIGAVKGKIVFHGKTYEVTGSWAASGSEPDRKFSAFAVAGSDGQLAPDYIVATGTMTGPGRRPENLQMSVTLTSTVTGRMLGWEDMLYPM